MPGVNLNKATAQVNNDVAHMEGRVETTGGLHPAWQAMIRFCQEMRYGEIACIKIHDGLPISAEVVVRKIRWY